MNSLPNINELLSKLDKTKEYSYQNCTLYFQSNIVEDYWLFQTKFPEVCHENQLICNFEYLPVIFDKKTFLENLK